MVTNTLGKIVGVRFGTTPDHPSFCGLEVELEADGGCCFFSNCVNLERAPAEESRAMLREIQKLLDAAKVQDIAGLVGKPVEVSFTERYRCIGFRILTEVL